MLGEKRSEDKWQDYFLAGHQIVCHYVGQQYRFADNYNPVDQDEVPVPHFGLVLIETQFHTHRETLVMQLIRFIVRPHKRFEGKPGEQWTMIFKDPCGIQSHDQPH